MRSQAKKTPLETKRGATRDMSRIEDEAKNPGLIQEMFRAVRVRSVQFRAMLPASTASGALISEQLQRFLLEA